MYHLLYALLIFFTQVFIDSFCYWGISQADPYCFVQHTTHPIRNALEEMDKYAVHTRYILIRRQTVPAAKESLRVWQEITHKMPTILKKIGVIALSLKMGDGAQDLHPL